MIRFQFKATNNAGVLYEGIRDAQDKYVLYKDLKKEGNIVVSATEIPSSNKNKPIFTTSVFLNIFKKREGVSIKVVDKIILARNIGSMLDAGLSLSRILSVIEHQSRNANLKRLLSKINDKVKSGVTLSEALKCYPRIFPSFFIAMVRSGEESGTLSNALKNLSDQMEKTYLLEKRIRGAFIYPGIILGLMFVIGILMMIFVVPTITATFLSVGATLPFSTRIVIGTSNFFNDHIVLVIAGIILAVAVFIKSIRTKAGQHFYDYVFLRIPVIGGLVKESNSARTARTLSSLLASGVQFVLAVEITRDVVQNLYYKKILSNVHDAVQKGESISAIFIDNEYYYPSFVGEMISVGEETGKLTEMLLSIAKYYEDEVEQKTKDMSTIIEPFLMIIIGLAVGFFAVSMIEPMYSVMNNV